MLRDAVFGQIGPCEFGHHLTPGKNQNPVAQLGQLFVIGRGHDNTGPFMGGGIQRIPNGLARAHIHPLGGFIQQ